MAKNKEQKARSKKWVRLNGLGQASSFSPSMMAKIPVFLRWVAGIGGGSAIAFWQINNRGN